MKETSNEPWWEQAARSVRQFPADLALVSLVVLVVDALLVFDVVGSAWGFLVGMPVLVFLPGYVLVAILFPARPRAASATARPRRIDGIERAALSFGLSIVVLAVYALALDLGPWSFLPATVLGGLTALVLVGALLGAVRRLELPESERFRVPVWGWYDEVRRGLLHPPSTVDGAVNFALAASVLVALGAFGYALAVPAPNAGYSNFVLLTETDGGEVVASGYPSEFAPGEQRRLVVGVTNHEGTRQAYTVVVELQRVRTDGGATVVEEEELTRLRTTLAPGETWHRSHAIAPEMQGEDLRLQYTLYRGDAPADAGADSAYRHLHLWISVGEESG